MGQEQSVQAERSPFEYLSCNWHCGVDRVGNDGHPGLRTVLCHASTQIGHNACTVHIVVSALVAGAGLICCLVTSAQACQNVSQLREPSLANVASNNLPEGLYWAHMS